MSSSTSAGAAQWRSMIAAVTMDQELLAGGRRTAGIGALQALMCLCCHLGFNTLKTAI